MDAMPVHLSDLLCPTTHTHTHHNTIPHTQQNALTEAGIPIDLSLAQAPTSRSSSLEQDYAEFKQPDANGDDLISRKEVRGFCV